MPLSISQPSWLPRRASVSSPTHAAGSSHTTHVAPSKPKSEDPSLNSGHSSPLDVGNGDGHNTDNAGSKSPVSSIPLATHGPSSHVAPPHGHIHHPLPAKHRASLFSAASDALGFRKKIGSGSRKKAALHPGSPTSDMAQEVIEISASNSTTVTSAINGTAAHRDYEHEERERLRDAAAQSIGLDPELLLDSCKSQSRVSLDSPGSPPQLACIPPFPATLAALCPFTILSSTLPKFNPPTSLLVYALAKQWKHRIIILTSHALSQKTHVHLFKDSSKDEREIERLEVTESSAIFVAEEEVGGRGNVVKLAGKTVSAKRSGPSGEEGSHAIWFLQIADPAESQRWIATIKNAVLAQRAVRAGLNIQMQTNGGNEPKGDIDVMLSMHMQGLITTHPIEPSATISFPSPTSPSPSPSLCSLKGNIPSSSSPTTAIKGLFSGTRSHSPSVEGLPISTYSPAHAEDFFGMGGIGLLTMLRTKSSADSSSSLSHSLPLPHPHVPGQGSPAPSLRSANATVIITASDLKISKERDTAELSTPIPEAGSSNIPSGSGTPPTPSLSPRGTLSLSLQPPPRNCKHISASVPATFLPQQQGMYKQAGGNRSVAGNFGISPGGSGNVTLKEILSVSPSSSSLCSAGWPSSLSPISDSQTQFCVGRSRSGEQSNEVAPTLSADGIVSSSSSPRADSVQSDKPSQGASTTKRRSRQGVPLPKQLTPPSGPPPSIPSLSENNPRSSLESSISMLITCTNTTDRSSASVSSNFKSQNRYSSRSGSSLSPTFRKRASGSSSRSVSSASTSDSRGLAQIPVSYGTKPFPSSTVSISGKRAPSRPISLLVPAPLSARRVRAPKRRSMPPPRPAPNFAPPPTPTIQKSMSEHTSIASAPGPHKSLRSSVAQRALRLSLTSPKPPPSSALPPRPDEVAFAPGHRRSSSAGTPNFHPISAPSSPPSLIFPRHSNSIDPTPPPRSQSIRQRLRILSTPPTSVQSQSPSFLLPPLQVSTLDLSDDNDEDLPTPCFQSSQPFGLGEHITTMQNDPSFLHLSTPVTPTAPKPPPRIHHRPAPLILASTANSLRTPPVVTDLDFISLSPPPPRRASKPHINGVSKRPEEREIEGFGSAHLKESGLVTHSQHGSVVSLGFVAGS